MIDFNIFHGLSTDLFSAPGVVNPNLLIEEGCWYLCTDTAELFLGTSNEEELTLRKVNANIIDQIATSIIKLELIDGKLIATYSDDTVVELGSVVEEIPEVNLAGYATESWVNEQGFLTSIPENFVTTEELANEGFIKEHQPLDDYVKFEDVADFITMSDVESKGYITEIPNKVSVFENDAKYATEQYVIDTIAEQVPVDNLAKKEVVEEVKTKLETEVLPTIQETILPVVQTAATQDWVKEQGYLTEHQDLSDYAKKTELFSKSYKDLIDTPEIPSVAGLASEEYVDNVVANIEYPAVDLSSYALKSELKAKANEIPFTRSKFVTKATGSFSVGDDVRGLTIAEILAKLLGLEADAEPEGIIEEIVAYEIPMYTVTSEGVLTEVPYNYINLDVETATAEPTESGFYQIVDQSGNITESGYQELQAYSNDIYYIIALPKEVDYNTMVAIKGYNTSLKVWAEVEKFEMTCDPAQVEALCSEAGIDISHIDTSVYTVWASEVCPTGSKLRYIINEEEAAI